MAWSRAAGGAALSVLVIALAMAVLAVVAHKTYSHDKLHPAAYATLLLSATGVSAWAATRGEFTLVRWVPVVVASLATLAAPWLGRDRNVVHPMRWEVVSRTGEPLPSDVEHIRLRFVERPNEFVGLYSNDLGSYLRSLDRSEVEVEFVVTYDLWFVRGFTVVRVGERRQWNNAWGNAGFDSTPEHPTHSMRFP